MSHQRRQGRKSCLTAALHTSAALVVFACLFWPCVVAVKTSWKVVVKPCPSCHGLASLVQALGNTVAQRQAATDRGTGEWDNVPAFELDVYSAPGWEALLGGASVPLAVLVGADSNGCGNVDDGAFVQLARARAFEGAISDEHAHVNSVQAVVISVQDGVSPLEVVAVPHPDR